MTGHLSLTMLLEQLKPGTERSCVHSDLQCVRCMAQGVGFRACFCRHQNQCREEGSQQQVQRVIKGRSHDTFFAHVGQLTFGYLAAQRLDRNLKELGPPFPCHIYALLMAVVGHTCQAHTKLGKRRSARSTFHGAHSTAHTTMACVRMLQMLLATETQKWASSSSACYKCVWQAGVHAQCLDSRNSPFSTSSLPSVACCALARSPCIRIQPLHHECAGDGLKMLGDTACALRSGHSMQLV